jgi:hypothetical protein
LYGPLRDLALFEQVASVWKLELWRDQNGADFDPAMLQLQESPCQAALQLAALQKAGCNSSFWIQLLFKDALSGGQLAHAKTY